MTELGRKLKEARESKGMSLSDIQELTKIQKRYLAGIEEGNYDIMPGKFYVRAFIKQYAEAVGLNAEELFEEFKSEVPSSKEDEVPLRPTGAAASEQKKVAASKPVRDSSKFLDYLPKILVTAFIIGALFLVWMLIPKGGSESEPAVDEKVQVQEDPAVENETPAVEEEPVKDEPAVEEPPAAPAQTLTAVSASGRQTVYELAGAKSFEVSVSSKGETWVEMADGSGKKYYSGMLANGQTQTHNLTGQTEAQIVVGFAPDTVITVNGEPLAYKLPAADEVRQDIVIRMKAQ
ncbi:helix-turn-helix domain-containing protein [Domibacillus epiphyticus]|uniref:Helix-turn-helix domain-containing protein n=1 Tax=Domibacillus epiphyticus TaxID=1714355 RepID=A0A1V2ACE1_9BACI|nr:RodZ domain-containing protein [Domibacillus epiphyticus]OMP68661.1 helix-turn-helix domain-containing protein [Domibacillus epiphyticus]